MKESLHALSGAYVVDALDDEEREAFEQHLPRCLDCQAEVASLREAAAMLADDVAMTPPDSLRTSVLAGISTIRPLPPERRPAAHGGAGFPPTWCRCAGDGFGWPRSSPQPRLQPPSRWA